MALLCAAALAWLLLRAAPEPAPLERKGELVEARETAVYRLSDSRIKELTLRSSTGLCVEIALRIPDLPLPGRPLVLLMGGQETGRAAAELVTDIRGVTVAAVTYPFGAVPHRDGLALTLALGRIQRGILDTPPAVLLALDYLHSIPDLSPGRVEIAGVSFGAFLAAVPGALDKRIQRVWLIHGAGNPAAVLAQGLEKRIPVRWLRGAVARYLAAVAAAHHLGPEHWVGRVSPRPLIVVNAEDDSSLPASAVKALHDALRPPFEVAWTRGDHIHPDRMEIVEEVSNLIFRRVAADSGTPHGP
jgi:hypothetical protein